MTVLMQAGRGCKDAAQIEERNGFAKRKDDKPSIGLALFGEGRASTTLVLWVGFLFSLMTSYVLLSWLPSLLIDSGCDVKPVQARMRHSSAKTTLDVYGHMWPDKDETTRAAIGGVIAARMALSSEDPAGSLRAKRS